MDAKNVEQIIQTTVRRFIDLERFYIFLFGSRAVGNQKPASDYDIGIYGKEKISFSVIAKIKDELDNYPIPVDVDIVDFSLVSSEFKAIALKEIKIWNHPNIPLKLC